MSVRKTLMTSLAIASMVAVPTIAQAAPTAASKLSVRAAPARVGAVQSRKSELHGSGIIIAVLAAAAVIAGVVIAADSNNSPTSA